MAAIGVIGAGFHGLVAASELKACGHEVMVLDVDQPAYDMLSPAFKFLEHTTDVTDFLDRLRVPAYTPYSVQVGLMRQGKVDHMRKSFSSEVFIADWRKTRLTAAPEHIPVSLEDPVVTWRKRAITLDWLDLRRRLLDGCNFVRCTNPVVEDSTIRFQASAFTFDAFVVAVPLWEVPRFFPGMLVPDAMATKLNFVEIETLRDKFVKWDVVYTPYTPCSTVHRIYKGPTGGFVCEFSGEPDLDKLYSDLHFLFPDGWHGAEDVHSTDGHLMPMAEGPTWPSNMLAVGPHATWDGKSTITSTLRAAAAFGITR